MVKLVDEDIRTREVLEWRGVHLLHAQGSSCSQKTRIFRNLKGIPWESHVVDLKAGENHTDWYLGINPRGLVPCLVHDGEVHIESNDIITYLEQAFPEPPLIPAALQDQIDELLEEEDDLHIDLRVLTFRFVIPTKPGAIRDVETLNRYRDHSGTIGGAPDPEKDSQIQFWLDANANGITDQQVADAAGRMHAALTRLDDSLQETRYLLGSAPTVVDIAWYVYAARIIAASYPLHRCHANVGAWFDRLDARPEFHSEVQQPGALRAASAALQEEQCRLGQSLEVIAGL